MVELRAHEIKVLSMLTERTEVSVEEVTKQCKLADSAVMRTALTLQEKGFVKIYQVIAK